MNHAYGQSCKGTVSRLVTIFLTFLAIMVIMPLAANRVYAADGATLGISYNEQNGSFTVTGHSERELFDTLFMYDGSGKKIYESIYLGEKDFTRKFHLSGYEYDSNSLENYPVGYYTCFATLKGSGEKVYTPSPAKIGIYDTPTLRQSSDYLISGSNFICYRAFHSVPADYDAFIQFHDGKKWGGYFGPFKSYEIKKISNFEGATKIKANTTYRARVCYAKNVQYGNDSYTIFGPYSNTVSIKTGKAEKPKIKSVKITKAKQQKKKLKSGGYWDAGGVWHPRKYTTSWTTTYKVTVKLKKKPGTKGIYIGDKKLKGNKTSYTTTISQSGKMIGKKVKLEIYTYNDDKLGGYSPSVTKKVKIKK